MRRRGKADYMKTGGGGKAEAKKEEEGDGDEV